MFHQIHSFKPSHFNITTLIVSALFLVMPSHKASAQPFEAIADHKDIVIAFYRTAGYIPNFHKWITEDRLYRTTPLARRKMVYDEEIEKLQSKYMGFDPAEDFLTIKTEARTIISKKVTYGEEEQPETEYFLELSFVKAPEATFFPYEFMDDKFAVIPKNLQNHLKLKIPEAQYERILRFLGETGKADMTFKLKPVEANIKSPVKLAGGHYWTLMTDIASMALWTDSGFLLWEYTAPWYVSPTTQLLQDLYVDKDPP